MYLFIKTILIAYGLSAHADHLLPLQSKIDEAESQIESTHNELLIELESAQPSYDEEQFLNSDYQMPPRYKCIRL